MTMMTLVEGKMVSGGAAQKTASKTEEVMAFCPGCKALQTVWFSDDGLLPTRKFTQIGTEIYHNCGAQQPCRLYHTS